MAKTAGWNSSKTVRGKLQAHLYWNRKRRRERVLAGAIPDGVLTDDSTSFELTANSGDYLIRD